VSETTRSVTEWAVLGLLAERPSHGFAIARQLAPGSEVGRVLTVRRPLTYRALDRLVSDSLAVPRHTEPGDAGPRRQIYRITPSGRRRLDEWLAEPVHHVRDLRIELLLKLVLLRRSDRSAEPLIDRQRHALAATFDALRRHTHPGKDDDEDEVDLWRRHAAMAASAYLDDLARRSGPAQG
jgi:DNA-binding PadR family transcriptional regulator